MTFIAQPGEYSNFVADVYLREQEKESDSEEDDVDIEKEPIEKKKLSKELTWNERVVMAIVVMGTAIYFICKYKCFPQPDNLELNLEAESALKSKTKQIVFGPATAMKARHKVTADEERLTRKYYRCKMDDPEFQSY